MGRKHYSSLYLAAIVLLGAVLRFYALGDKSVWLDEAFSIWMANHSLPALWGWLIRIDQHPPLYYTLLSAWQRFFGDLQGPVRLLSALCSTLAIPFFYAVVKRISGSVVTALLAAGILALSPFHVRFAQETRMYALLTLGVAATLYFVTQVVDWTAEPEQPALAPGRFWLGLAVSQAAVMLTHNTAAVFFPLALNLPLFGIIRHRHEPSAADREASPQRASNHPRFLRYWLRTQLLALLLWSPWAIPFVRQSIGVARRFWIRPPTAGKVWETLHTFNFAFLPSAFPLTPVWILVYLGLAGLGLQRLRQRKEWRPWLLSLLLTPIVGELLVSLYRPIYRDRTLIWATLPYYLFLALGLYNPFRQPGTASSRQSSQRYSGARQFFQRFVQSLHFSIATTLVVLLLSSAGLYSYYHYFQKEEWDAAAAYVAQRAKPEDLLLFNATWVQLPFDYYFRRYDLALEERGAPVDLFQRGLEPEMEQADLPRLQVLVANQPRVWLVYSHDWYTDPLGLIPRQLRRTLRQVDEQQFRGLRVLEFVPKSAPNPSQQ